MLGACSQSTKRSRPLPYDRRCPRSRAAGIKRPMPDYPEQALQAGTAAPDFTLHSTPDQSVSLADFKGSPLIMAFYPADWSPVCTDQMALYNEILSEFQRFGATIAGISVDSAWCHLAFAEHRKLRFPLLADFEPKGAVARHYGVYHDAGGTSERALFVIDHAGVIRRSYLSPMGVNPGADGILRALEGLGATVSGR